MTASDRDEQVYVDFILQAIGRIEEYTRGGRDEFMPTPMIQDAVVRNLQTLCEAMTQLSESSRAAHPEIPWRVIVAFRNILTHDYLGVMLERVWPVIEVQIPELKRAILEIRSARRPE